MKTPIEPSEIRKGDLIRWEGGAENATEWRAHRDRDRYAGSGQHYLLDRPTPAVELPTEPTLGWLTRYIGEESSGLGRTQTHLGAFHAEDDSDRTFEVDSLGAHVDFYSDVTAFTPATAVPTDALDELRKVHSALGTLTRSGDAIRDFLAAVDKAGESA